MISPKYSISETTLVLLLYIVATCFLVTLLILPRAVPPEYLPALPVNYTATSTLIAHDKALAHQKALSPEAKTLIELYEEQGLAEAGLLEVEDIQNAAAMRRNQIKQGVHTFILKHGALGLRALQAHTLSQLKSALVHPEKRENQALLGSFPRMLERYGLQVDGKCIAPYPVIRTLFKARWNFIHERAPTDSFTLEELRNYHGWLIMHAPNVSMERKFEAFTFYKQAGGSRANETLGTLLYQNGQYARAFQAFSKAYMNSGALRLRNHAFAAQAAESLVTHQ